jgi:hypothetical protein
LKNIFTRAGFAALALGALAFGADPGSTLRAIVPFEFVVGGQKLPAGEYTIQESLESGMLVLHLVGSKQTLMLLSEPAGVNVSDREPGLVFERRNGEARLVRMQPSSGGIARILPIQFAK